MSSTAIQAQASLTKQELEILDKINAQNSQSTSSSSVPSSSENSSQNVLLALQQTIQQETEELESFSESIGEIEDTIDEIIDKYSVVQKETEKLLLDDVLEFNILQLHLLKEKIDESREAEVERRYLKPDIITVETIIEELTMENEEVEDGNENNEDVENEDESTRVTKEQLKEIISAESLKKNVEQKIVEKMTEFISKVIPTKIISPVLSQFEDEFEEKSLALNVAKESVKKIVEENKQVHNEQCVDYTSAINMVQSSIWEYENDGGVYDYLSDGGGVVVYGDNWTSNSYIPTPASKVSDDIGFDKVTLGDYQQYVPEDWARLLPEGWEETDVTFIHKFLRTDPRSNIPTSLWHSIPLPLKKFLSPPGNLIALPKAPETIMNKNNHLGSCWAMAGSSGKITIRLKEPMSLRSLTIDHYPGLLSAHKEPNADKINQSAPRFITVIGYPPCKDEDKDTLDCIKLGFDRLRPLNLESFEFHPVPSIDNSFEDNAFEPKPRRSSQRFSLKLAHTRDNENIGEEEERGKGIDKESNNKLGTGEEGFSSGSCSAVKPTCGSENVEISETTMPRIASFTVVVDENWGEEDFTCIYRIRAHA